MGIVLEVVEDNAPNTVLSVPTNDQQVIVNTTNQQVVLTNNPTSVVIEVPRGLPGLQNVVVSPTAPANPEENMVWIDIS